MSQSNRAARDQAKQVLEAQRRRRVRQQGLTAALIAVGLVVAAIAAMIVAKVTGGGSDSAALPTGSAAAIVIDQVTKVSPSVLDAAGRGKTTGLPKPIKNVPALTVDGKPLVLYVGAEFCPFCASQRWAVVIALSRFGTFSNLGLTRSASEDVYPNTQSLSFHGSTFTSDYLVFQGVETATNEKDGRSYKKLDSLTPQQAQVMQTLNASPYLPKQAAGTIPFMAIGNQFVYSGSGYNPGLLKGRSAVDIARLISGNTSTVSQGILGTANAITTAVCELTDGQPGAVCGSPAAKAYSGSLS